MEIETVAVIAGVTLQTQRGSVHEIEKVIIHPLFNYNTLNDDVSLIRVCRICYNLLILFQLLVCKIFANVHLC